MPLEPALRQLLSRFVPAGMIDRLNMPDAPPSALNDVLQHINSLHKAVASFLPLYLTEDDSLLASHYRALRPGTFMFADVSGFTALSERLQMQNNAEGAENLTIIMNQFFARMLEILANCDGMLIKFAGDALLAFFPAAEIGSENAADAAKAVRTALRMQRAMTIFQPIGDPRLVELLGSIPMSLSMSIGVARGQLFETLVGNAIQREHIIQGALPRLTMEAESVGVRDDVIVPETLATLLDGQFTFQPLKPGFFQVIDDLGDHLGDYEFDLVRRRRAKPSAIFLDPENLMDYLRAQLVRLQTVARYISPAVLHELVGGGTYHIHSENRSATVMFIYATGFSELLEHWGNNALESISSLVERYYNLIHQIATAEGGAVTRTDPYQQGIKILISFGALVSHQDDPQRAVGVALEMNRSLAHFNARLREGVPPDSAIIPHIEHRIGITQGRTFSGEVGWKARREYTVMGDEVNLAARLMARAEPGQILISERVQRRIESVFEIRHAPPQPLKGKSQPVKVFEVIGASKAKADQAELPLIGHDLVNHTLTLALRDVINSQKRSAHALLGESGVGKTRIAREVLRIAMALDFRVAWATCQPRASRRTTWDNIVSSLLDLDAVAPTDGMSMIDAQRLQLTKRLTTLDLMDLESALCLLCFGGAPTDDSDDPLGQSQIDNLKDIYKRFENVTTHEGKSTGIFKRVRTKLENKTQSEHTSRNLWLRVQNRISTMETVARLINRLAQETPLLLVIDGLENEHPNALAVLRHVLDDSVTARLMIVLTWETPAEFDLPVQHIVIPDLNEDETHLMAMELLNVRELGSRLGELLWERTNGRPLFIESFVRTLVENECIDGDTFVAELKPNARVETLPENIRDLMISRFDRLPPDLQNIVRNASIFNGGFTLDMLIVVTAANVERNAVPIQDAFKQPIIPHIFDITPDGLYLFHNRTMQEAIYENLSRTLRLKLHRAAAGYWRTQPIREEQVVALAYHLGKCGLLPEALEVVTRAADDALAVDDLDGAIDLFTHALTLFPDEKSIRLRLERLNAGEKT
ncbi:MAG: adenylate/guanylate cyclase domain-containing protein [Chloroflexota bacterium]|nr:adenylate/guanylate cyclase domain-containing protein [Chloroflexota bacterium]